MSTTQHNEAETRDLVIVNHIGPEMEQMLKSHWSRPEVVSPSPEAPRWDFPRGARVLVTTPVGWRAAPTEKPPGWPFCLRWIQTNSAGIDAFPPWFLEGPVVTCGRGLAAVPIAEYVMSAILAYEKRFEEARIRQRSGWRHVPMGSLEDRTLGIAGFGALGTAIADRARAFGMRILALRRTDSADCPDDVEPVRSIAELASRAEHLVLALPITPSTRRIINRTVLAAAKPGIHIINVARGGLIDQEALLDALDAGVVSRASLDVSDPEPLPEGHPFYAHPRVRLTPHVSWEGIGNEGRQAALVLENLTAFVQGSRMRNIVEAERGY